MPHFSAQATVLGYTVGSNPGEITATYLIQDQVFGFNGGASVSVAISEGDSPHDIRQAVSAAIQSNPGTSQVNGSIKIEYLV